MSQSITVQSLNALPRYKMMNGIFQTSLFLILRASLVEPSTVLIPLSHLHTQSPAINRQYRIKTLGHCEAFIAIPDRRDAVPPMIVIGKCDTEGPDSSCAKNSIVSDNLAMATADKTSGPWIEQS